MKKYKIEEAFLGNGKKVKTISEIVDKKFIYLYGDAANLILEWIETGQLPVVFLDINNDVVIARNKNAAMYAKKSQDSASENDPRDYSKYRDYK